VSAQGLALTQKAQMQMATFLSVGSIANDILP
jgi:hypothetical protein